MKYIMTPYDDALKSILANGERRNDRTGVGSISLFGHQTRFPLGESFPLLTKRKVWPRAVFAELLWMISGSSNNNDLVDLGAKFWTPWVSEEFEKKHGFAPGQLGPVYGFQLRHFGGDYATQSGGVDQLAFLVDELKRDKYSRRAVISYWNPAQLDSMRLPPCHYTYQACIDGKDRISGMLTQRSADFPVGVPANIQFYSALTLMLAQQLGCEPHEFVHNTGDSHIYMDQIDAVEEYLSRPETDSPTLKLHPASDIFSYTMDDFEIENYAPQGPIKIPVAV